jgi:hypothetical protein
MSDEQVQTFEETVNAFYPDAESEPLEVPTDEAAEGELPEEDETTEDVDESEAEESEGGEEEADGVEDVQSVEIDGTEHNLTDIQEWKEAHDNVKLMQADCTKKWQEAADLKKDAETQSTKAQELVLELELMVGEDKELDLESYKDIESDNYDPDEYIRLKDKADKREAKLKELKANQPTQQAPLTQDELVAESNDFYSYDPAWQNDGKLTDAFQSDMKVAAKYLSDAGYSQEEINAVTYSHHWKTIVDASRYNAQKNKVTSIKKKVLKTPKASKPAAKSSNQSAEEIFYGKQ